MTMERFLATSLLVCAMSVATAAEAPRSGEHDWLTQHPTIQRLVTLTNQHRAQYGLPPVQINAEMSLSAHRHAGWMADSGALQHSGLPYREIIFLGPTTAEAAIQGWIYSPAHNANMLSGSEVGFGYVYRNGRPAWVGVFR